MRTNLSILTVSAACLLLTSACAPSVQPYAPPTPPRRVMPATAEQACLLPVLPAQPTDADYEATYTARGAVIVACDAARKLAVDTHAGEHADEDAWLRDLARNPFVPKRGN